MCVLHDGDLPQHAVIAKDDKVRVGLTEWMPLDLEELSLCFLVVLATHGQRTAVDLSLGDNASRGDV